MQKSSSSSKGIGNLEGLSESPGFGTMMLVDTGGRVVGEISTCRRRQPADWLCIQKLVVRSFKLTSWFGEQIVHKDRFLTVIYHIHLRQARKYITRELLSRTECPLSRHDFN